MCENLGIDPDEEVGDGSEGEESHKPGSEMQSDSDDEDEDMVEDLPLSVLQAKKNMRTSVSAEAFGIHNKKEDFTPPVIAKSEQTKSEISSRLRQSFMFQGLNEEEMRIVTDAMEIIFPGKREFVIKEGEDGDCMFVLEQGKLKATKYLGND